MKTKSKYTINTERNRILKSSVKDEDYVRACNIIRDLEWAKKIIQKRLDEEEKLTPFLVRFPEIKKALIILDDEFHILTKSKRKNVFPIRFYFFYLIRQNYRNNVSLEELSFVFKISHKYCFHSESRIDLILKNKRQYSDEYHLIKKAQRLLKDNGIEFEKDDFKSC